jgi:hypothetical protein
MGLRRIGGGIGEHQVKTFIIVFNQCDLIRSVVDVLREYCGEENACLQMRHRVDYNFEVACVQAPLKCVQTCWRLNLYVHSDHFRNLHAER